MDGITLLDWFKGLLTQSTTAIEFLTTPTTVGNWTVTPIELIGITGLVGFIALAIVMWVVSSVT